MEFGSNRSDGACGIVVGETTNKKHLISQREGTKNYRLLTKSGSF
jgi:hypothetical protein